MIRVCLICIYSSLIKWLLNLPNVIWSIIRYEEVENNSYKANYNNCQYRTWRRFLLLTFFWRFLFLLFWRLWCFMSYFSWLVILLQIIIEINIACLSSIQFRIVETHFNIGQVFINIITHSNIYFVDIWISNLVLLIDEISWVNINVELSIWGDFICLCSLIFE